MKPYITSSVIEEGAYARVPYKKTKTLTGRMFRFGLLQAQDSKCAICKGDISLEPIWTTEGRRQNVERAVLDHCHKTGFVRSYLCHSCNIGLRLFEEDELLDAALTYILTHRMLHADRS